MSGFGRRPPAMAPLGSSASRTPGGPLPASGALPFSFLALGGALLVSALLTLLGLPVMTNAMAALPEMAELGQKQAKTVNSFFWWALLAGGVIWGLSYCVIAHWIARFLESNQLWLFALLGLAPSAFGFFFMIGQTGASGGPPLLWDLIVILHGPLTTSTYWLIAKMRAA